MLLGPSFHSLSPVLCPHARTMSSRPYSCPHSRTMSSRPYYVLTPALVLPYYVLTPALVVPYYVLTEHSIYLGMMRCATRNTATIGRSTRRRCRACSSQTLYSYSQITSKHFSLLYRLLYSSSALLADCLLLYSSLALLADCRLLYSSLAHAGRLPAPLFILGPAGRLPAPLFILGPCWQTACSSIHPWPMLADCLRWGLSTVSLSQPASRRYPGMDY